MHPASATPPLRHRATRFVRGGLWAAAASLAAAAFAAADGGGVVPARAPVSVVEGAASSLPPAGRAIFDDVLARLGWRPGKALPFPLPVLLGGIRRELAAGGKDGLPVVLIPLGRSLQRNAADQVDTPAAYFAYPRVVAAVTGEPAAGAPLLKDRLYLGYHERAAVLEVISYNEAAGRFEFQLVRNYRAGGEGELRYANRRLCLACHQNAGPIFSRPSWDETSANPRLAEWLQRQGRKLDGLDWRHGIDVPNAIDDASDRANRLALAQKVWREGCGGVAAGNVEAAVRCRGQALALAVLYRLSQGRGVAAEVPAFREAFAHPLRAAWRQRWPGGLAVPSADLPNRLPLAGRGEASGLPSAAELRRLADVTAPFDPLNLRPPLEVLRGEDAEAVSSAVQAMALILADSDVRALDRALRKAQPVVAEQPVQGCSVTERTAAAGERRLFLRCETPRLELALQWQGERVEGHIERVDLAASPPLRNLVLGAPRREDRGGAALHVALTPLAEGLAPRTAEGLALREVVLSWPAGEPERVEVVLRLADELPVLQKAIDGMAEDSLAGRSDALDGQPLRRSVVLPALFHHLGQPVPPLCCDNPEPAGGSDKAGHELPPPRGEESHVMVPAPGPELAILFRRCALCHASGDRFPPGFLRGEGARLAANVDGCAERILYRLGMARLAPGVRPKTPMPPPASSEAAGFAESSDFERLRQWLAGRAGVPAQDVLTRPYVQLAACAPQP